MLRLLVNDAGDCFGKFGDGSSVFISSSCQLTVETGKDNKQVTRVMDYINDSLKQKISQMVHVRNTYFSPISLPQFMLKAGSHKKVCSLHITFWIYKFSKIKTCKSQNQAFVGDERCSLESTMPTTNQRPHRGLSRRLYHTATVSKPAPNRSFIPRGNT